jgi:DNA primase
MAVSDDIKARLDVVDTIAQYVPELKRSGRNFTARCPFHQEKTPSFVVFPEQGTWRCFGACATGGDLFAFIMRAESIDFSAALRSLAAQAGVTLTTARREGRRTNAVSPVNQQGQRYFLESLSSERGTIARDYLQGRGVTEDMAARFGLGYSSAGGDDLVRWMEGKGVRREEIVQAGLATRLEGGGVRDLFRGRLVFPIRDSSGVLVGFAGRSMDGSNPKYLNTPGTATFDKGSILYGMDEAATAITNEGVVVVVEGYMDVITAHGHGYQNVVASMGTAVTERQVEGLRRAAHRIVLALDPDAAGQEATLRSLETSWRLLGDAMEGQVSKARRDLRQRSTDMEALRIAVLPEKEDPDALIRRDPSAWRELITKAIPVVEFLMNTETNRLDLGTSQGKAQMVERLMPLIYATPDWAEQAVYFDRLAGLVGVSREELRASVGRIPPARAKRDRRDKQTRTGTVAESIFRGQGGDVLEAYTLALVIQYPELIERSAGISLDHFQRIEHRALLSAIREAGTIEQAAVGLDEHLLEQLSLLSEREFPPADRTQRGIDLDACGLRLEERYLRGLKAQEEVVLSDVFNEETGSRDSEYVDAINRQAVITNERLRQLFITGGSVRKA